MYIFLYLGRPPPPVKNCFYLHFDKNSSKIKYYPIIYYEVTRVKNISFDSCRENCMVSIKELCHDFIYLHDFLFGGFNLISNARSFFFSLEFSYCHWHDIIITLIYHISLSSEHVLKKRMNGCSFYISSQLTPLKTSKDERHFFRIWPYFRNRRNAFR